MRPARRCAIYIPAFVLAEFGEACPKDRVTLALPSELWARAAFTSGKYHEAELTAEILYVAQSSADHRDTPIPAAAVQSFTRHNLSPSPPWKILVRLKQTNDIQPFYVYSMEIPDHLILTPKSLPARWRSRIAVSRAFIDAWLKTNNLPALRVPTVITPGEWSVLVNPLHPQFSLKWVVGSRRLQFDARLLPVTKGFGLVRSVGTVTVAFFLPDRHPSVRSSLSSKKAPG